MSAPYVVCIGVATLDTIFAVPRLPLPDDRVDATDFAVAGGGPAATAAVTLARLGVPAFFVGVVGDDEVGTTIRAGLAREGVDVSELAVSTGADSPQSSILVTPGARAIAHYRGTVPPHELTSRAHELCRGAAWVHVDHFGYGAAPRDARLSIDAGSAIDGLELEDVALYAPAESALREQFGDEQGALDAGAELVVVTRGEEGSVAYGRDGTVVEAPGLRVDAVSTLGAGDVFHGALLAQLVAEVPLRDALVFANACAALSCRALDGRSAIPTLDEVAA
jgi:sugar/nucleoside kinase (ribokinase family)